MIDLHQNLLGFRRIDVELNSYRVCSDVESDSVLEISNDASVISLKLLTNRDLIVLQEYEINVEVQVCSMQVVYLVGYVICMSLRKEPSCDLKNTTENGGVSDIREAGACRNVLNPFDEGQVDEEHLGAIYKVSITSPEMSVEMVYKGPPFRDVGVCNNRILVLEEAGVRILSEYSTVGFVLQSEFSSLVTCLHRNLFCLCNDSEITVYQNEVLTSKQTSRLAAWCPNGRYYATLSHDMPVTGCIPLPHPESHSQVHLIETNGHINEVFDVVCGEGDVSDILFPSRDMICVVRDSSIDVYCALNYCWHLVRRLSFPTKRFFIIVKCSASQFLLLVRSSTDMMTIQFNKRYVFLITPRCRSFQVHANQIRKTFFVRGICPPPLYHELYTANGCFQNVCGSVDHIICFGNDFLQVIGDNESGSKIIQFATLGIPLGLVTASSLHLWYACFVILSKNGSELFVLDIRSGTVLLKWRCNDLTRVFSSNLGFYVCMSGVVRLLVIERNISVRTMNLTIQDADSIFERDGEIGVLQDETIIYRGAIRNASDALYVPSMELLSLIENGTLYVYDVSVTHEQLFGRPILEKCFVDSGTRIVEIFKDVAEETRIVVLQARGNLTSFVLRGFRGPVGRVGESPLLEQTFRSDPKKGFEMMRRNRIKMSSVSDSILILERVLSVIDQRSMIEFIGELHFHYPNGTNCVKSLFLNFVDLHKTSDWLKPCIIILLYFEEIYLALRLASECQSIQRVKIFKKVFDRVDAEICWRKCVEQGDLALARTVVLSSGCLSDEFQRLLDNWQGLEPAEKQFAIDKYLLRCQDAILSFVKLNRDESHQINPILIDRAICEYALDHLRGLKSCHRLCTEKIVEFMLADSVPQFLEAGWLLCEVGEFQRAMKCFSNGQCLNEALALFSLLECYGETMDGWDDQFQGEKMLAIVAATQSRDNKDMQEDTMNILLEIDPFEAITWSRKLSVHSNKVLEIILLEVPKRIESIESKLEITEQERLDKEDRIGRMERGHVSKKQEEKQLLKIERQRKLLSELEVSILNLKSRLITLRRFRTVTDLLGPRRLTRH